MLERDGYLVAQGSSRVDHPAAPPEPATTRIYEDSGYLWVDGSNSTDVSHHASIAYYEIYEQLRARHPTLLLEVCNDGGRMVDFGSAAHGDYFSITDSYDPLSNRRAFYDASFVLPPAMLESYVKNWPAPREADVYHAAERPDGVQWDGIEYYSASLRRGVLYAFRGTAPDQPTHRFRLLGLKTGSRYRLKFQDQDAAANLVLAGQSLMQEGVEVTLGVPLSSELLFLEEVQQ
jgi:Melibiase/Glycosyl hydrolase family 36 C-terminal domain